MQSAQNTLASYHDFVATLTNNKMFFMNFDVKSPLHVADIKEI